MPRPGTAGGDGFYGVGEDQGDEERRHASTTKSLSALNNQLTEKGPKSGPTRREHTEVAPEVTPKVAPDEVVAFVIELRHFKPKKKKTSVKGWCFFSLSELDLSRQTQRLSLEVYAKPVDARCRKMKLLSKKELYAHVDVIVHTE